MILNGNYDANLIVAVVGVNKKRKSYPDEDDISISFALLER